MLLKSTAALMFYGLDVNTEALNHRFSVQFKRPFAGTETLIQSCRGGEERLGPDLPCERKCSDCRRLKVSY